MPPLPPATHPYRHTLAFMVANLNLNVTRLNKMALDAEPTRKKQLRDLAYKLGAIRTEIEELDS